MCKVLSVTTENGNKGIELYFDDKPGAEILNRLKAAFFRWHKVKKCWYHKDTPEARAIADEVSGGAALTEQNGETKTPKPSGKAKVLPPLWERCDISSIPAHPKNWDEKDIAAEVRKHLRERFPEVKFSLRCGRSGYTGSINGEILAAPYGREHIMKDRRTGEPDRWGYMQNSDELEAVLKYFDAYLQSYNYDNSDYMTDYFDVGFYGRFEIASKYEQTEATPEQAADMAAFKAAKTADDERKAAELEARIEQEQREREEAAKGYEIRRAQQLKDIEAINAHIEVIDLAESEQIAITDLMQGIGKENCLREVDEEIERKENEAIQKGVDLSTLCRDAIISRKVMFVNSVLFDKFCGLFLDRWDFAAGKGGSSSEDVRLEQSGIKTLQDLGRLTAEQRASIKFFEVDCVGVYLNGVLQFVIDPQGYEYCRYVMRPTADTEERPAPEYCTEQRKNSEGLPAFYIPAPLSEQIAAADFRKGEQITALVMDGMLCSVITYRGKLLKVVPCEYAQYKDAAYIEFIPNGKRKAYGLYIHKGQNAVIYRGDLPEPPDELLHTRLSDKMYRLNYSGQYADDFIKKAIAYYAGLGYTPAIDLVQR